MSLVIKNNYIFYCSFLLFFILFISNKNAYCEFAQEKGKHFIAEYPETEDDVWIREILQKAESYYDNIAKSIGYTRYKDFWTWENRVKIKIFKDKKSYLKSTDLPSWTLGLTIREHSVFKSRAIVSYRQEQGFLDGVLPHEISHLILRDFIGFDNNIPIWFDEGVAQLAEKNKREINPLIMKKLVEKDFYIPFNKLFKEDIRVEQDSLRVAIFYTQSLSIIDFLLNKYGSRRFGQLCRNMRSGKDFEESLKLAYVSIFDSIGEFEKKWLRYIRE